ncbi:MAG: NADP oxidoreductase [Methanobacteriota archaeon]|nr:MAG: NADP oxidoreductase [Euryarchaeota archaeon]
MKIGILGSGDVGRALGSGFASHGHDVMIGTRTTSKPELVKWQKAAGKRASLGTFANAAAHGEVLLLCTRGDVTEAAIELAGPKNFDGKVVIDVTNPLDFSKGMPPSLFVGTTDSLGERIQRKLPKAKVVKCFNIVSNETMIDPKMKDGTPDMLIAGNDAGAKKAVAGILKEFGWGDPIDVGGIDGARWLEAWTPLWVRICQAVDSWSVAFRVLRS